MEHLLDVGPDLHVLPAARRPQILYSRHLVPKPAPATELSPDTEA